MNTQQQYNSVDDIDLQDIDEAMSDLRTDQEDKPSQGTSNESTFVQHATPLAILISGIMISGAIIYSSGGLDSNLEAKIQSPDKQDNMLSLQNIVRWVDEDLKLNDKEFEKCIDDNRYTDVIDADLELGTSLGVTGTPTLFVNGTRVVGAQSYEIFNEIIQQALADKNQKDVAIEINSNDNILGNPNAPVTIVEFSDFECPFCQRFFVDALQQIKENYIASNQVRFVYKHFPLSIHNKAIPAAIASECAGEQGQFWQMHDLIFTKQI